MRIAVAGDARTDATDEVLHELRRRGHELVKVLGPAGGRDEEWAECGLEVGKAVATGEADMGVLFCHTGTSVSMAANKVHGVRAALCTDAEQAEGARKWNDANVLAMSLRLTTPELARNILDAWFKTTELDPAEVPNIDKVKSADR